MTIFEKIRQFARKPMQEAGVYDPMEQAGHGLMVPIDTVERLLKEMEQDLPTVKKAEEEVKKWAHGGAISSNMIYVKFVDMVKKFQKKYFGEVKK